MCDNLSSKISDVTETVVNSVDNKHKYEIIHEIPERHERSMRTRINMK
jgi:hypothetical protein